MQLLQKCLSLLQLKQPNSKINFWKSNVCSEKRDSSIYGTADMPIFIPLYYLHLLTTTYITKLLEEATYRTVSFNMGNGMIKEK